MAKAMYTLKIYWFRTQIQLTLQETRAVRSLGVFIALSYVRYWNEAMIARYAPKNDLDFMCLLQSGLPERNLAETALTAWKRHLWYVSEELVGLAFFDERVDNKEKITMIQNLKKHPKGLKRLDCKNFDPRQPLSEFVTAKSMSIFEVLLADGTYLAKSLLQKMPREWNEDPIYRRF